MTGAGEVPTVQSGNPAGIVRLGQQEIVFNHTSPDIRAVSKI